MISDKRIAELRALLAENERGYGVNTYRNERELLNALPELLDALVTERAVAEKLADTLMNTGSEPCPWKYLNCNRLHMGVDCPMELQIGATCWLDWARKQVEEASDGD